MTYVTDELTPRQQELMDAMIDLLTENHPDFGEMISLGVWLIGNAVLNAPPSTWLKPESLRGKSNEVSR